mmetsp:Transcript_16450/g.19012  ORF Transcript_16450/g.19012 Transcript_16450/m.19012 type:complete len:95 (+) Transcript_16450:17-301(+)|eukprot:CAMPEP_0168334660 /NCGR_PEP_ID=MMETSP0213-20121227/10417_1 /TAXON_ID=151035 /ORGANISM="Euplotes harpa, Strain FSP1.4" /LENGTH=94 /DNA_ID=CAMNT_0008339381 /DNA_START=111 /DNA_END=395 /DNA_ORIENTATION=+
MKFLIFAWLLSMAVCQSVSDCLACLANDDMKWCKDQILSYNYKCCDIDDFSFYCGGGTRGICSVDDDDTPKSSLRSPQVPEDAKYLLCPVDRDA